MGALLKQFIIVAAFLAHQYTFSQYFSAKVDGLGLIIPDLTMIRPSIEGSFNRHFSAGLVFEKGKYRSGSTSTNFSTPKEIYKVTGKGLMSEIRYYPFSREKPAPLGFFLGTYFRFQKLIEEYTGEDYLLKIQGKKASANLISGANAWNYGASIGYKYNLHIAVLEFCLVSAEPMENGKILKFVIGLTQILGLI